MKFLPLIFLLVSLKVYAQNNDTPYVDTTKLAPDSLFKTLTDTIKADTILAVQSYHIADTLSPLFQKPFYDESFFINRPAIDFLDYRYAGNLFSPFSAAILKDKGFIGQLNQLMFYSSDNAGFLEDGLMVNNRYGNYSFDLNLVQNESIDSIEVIPLPRGFLYGAEMFPASVNFINKDFLSAAPFTRIKYYEGPEGEAFIDVIFSTLFYSRFNFYLDVTNNKFDGVYTNSDFSIWQVKAQLKYMLSNSINLIGSYSLKTTEVGLNGGVDVDSISKITADINSILYEPLTAPVVYPALRQEVKQNKFKLRTFGRFNNFYTDLNFYYNSEKENYTGIPSKDELKNFIWGASLRQSYSPSVLKFELNSVLEKRELNYYFVDTASGLVNQKLKNSILSVSPVLSLYLVDSTLIPSVFFKYSENLSYNLGANHGFGADVTFKLLQMIKLYFGISKFDLFNRFETDVYELGASLTYNCLLVDLRLYNKKNFSSYYSVRPANVIASSASQIITGDISGIALNLNYDLWKLGIESCLNINSFDKAQNVLPHEVKKYFSGGIFYKDILFNNNLNLKTGFNLKYYRFENGYFDSAFQIDFTVAGRIQDAAIVYFSWENLLDKKYYIVPFYPMRERGIRFGLSWELFN
jgi:hypothetical protein